MPLQFEKYRFTKKTPLSDETFNRIFRDLDLRIASLEDIKKDWEYVVRETTQQALRRIEEVLRPSWEYIEDRKAHADTLLAQIQQTRNTADEVIYAQRDSVLQEVQSERQQSLTAISTTKTQALQEIQNARTSALQDIENARQDAISQLDITRLYAMTFFFGGE